MIWLLLLSLIGTDPAPTAAACYCAMGSLEDDVRAATHVVVGRVLRVRAVPTSDVLEEHEATLLVEASWKGVTTGDTLRVWDPLPTTDCSAGFYQGWQNLVFARPAAGETTQSGSGRLVAMTCWRSRPVKFARGTLDSLGPPRTGRWRP